MIAIADSEFPSLSQITRLVLEYWAGRARSAKHPVLRARYADLVWDFREKVPDYFCAHDLPRILIHATTQITTLELGNHRVSIIKKLRRTLAVAISLRDAQCVDTVTCGSLGNRAVFQ
jgi:hypothetical protein